MSWFGGFESLDDDILGVPKSACSETLRDERFAFWHVYLNCYKAQRSMPRFASGVYRVYMDVMLSSDQSDSLPGYDGS